jgi:hypothetical protein
MNCLIKRQSNTAECKIIYGFAALVELGRFFSFLIIYTVGRNPWTGDQPDARPLPAQDNTNTV